LLQGRKDAMGVKRKSAAAQQFSRVRSEVDMDRQAKPAGSVENDAEQTRAAQNCCYATWLLNPIPLIAADP